MSETLNKLVCSWISSREKRFYCYRGLIVYTGVTSRGVYFLAPFIEMPKQGTPF